MALAQIISAIAGFSALLLLGLPELRKWQRRQIVAGKLRVVTEALEQADEMLIRFQERHDRILHQINSHYLNHKEMGEALAGARNAMNEAQELCACLRRLQMTIVSTYPYGSSA